MAKEGLAAPFILKPARINNFTHLIALLKIKQNKYKNYNHKSVNTQFSNVLGEKIEGLNASDIIEGFLHEKLRDKYSTYEKEIHADFDRFLNNKIKEIKKENDQKIYNVKIGNVRDVEELLFSKPTKFSFKDDLLFDLYLYLNHRKEPMEFLQSSYLNYVKAFMNLQKPSFLNAEKDSKQDDTFIKHLVSEFVKLRFNREEFSIEAYEGRYLWAEVFIFYRIGRIDLARHLLSEYEIFFEFMAQKFRTAFSDYLNKKSTSTTFSLSVNDDKFKKILFGLIDGKPKSDGIVINSVEDYLWMKMLNKSSAKKDIVKDLVHFENPKTVFMICLLTKQYKKSIDILLKSDFNLIAKFFLLRELCLEQALDIVHPEQESGFRAHANLDEKPLIKNVAHADESSTSSFSLLSEPGFRNMEYYDKGLDSVNPIFLNFMFSIVARISTRENKVKFIEMLKNYGDYYKVVPFYVIKYNLFDIIGQMTGSDNGLDFYLDNELTSRVVEMLKTTRNKQKLIQLHRLIPDETMVNLLIEVLEEGILIDEQVDAKIVDDYINKIKIKDVEKLKNLYGLYQFNLLPSFSNLRNTVIFESNQDLVEYKFVIEKILPRAIDIIKSENDREMARTVFKLCGVLELNEECCNKASKELMMLI